ncbi:hypothetical protein EB155_05535 [archaeon]|nr:hypothetical protein [archaeon]
MIALFLFFGGKSSVIYRLYNKIIIFRFLGKRVSKMENDAEWLVMMCKRFENRETIKSRCMFKEYRMKLERRVKLERKNIEHLLKFLVVELRNSGIEEFKEANLRKMLERFVVDESRRNRDDEIGNLDRFLI